LRIDFEKNIENREFMEFQTFDEWMSIFLLVKSRRIGEYMLQICTAPIPRIDIAVTEHW
jgi:hypothetical protein